MIGRLFCGGLLRIQPSHPPHRLIAEDRQMPTAEAAFPAEPHSARVARRFVAGALDQWSATEYEVTAALLLSELVTNAVLHARTDVTVRVALDEQMLRLEVADGSHRLPFRRHYSVQATTGRGLALVDSLSRRWGVEAHTDGKTIWCELDPPQVMSESEDGGVDLDAYPDLEETDVPGGIPRAQPAAEGQAPLPARGQAA
jgi:anti-sigma regulatory factor (Ser/Thr protein kinase)